MADGTTVRVALGECLAALAYQRGHVWKTLWDAPENRELCSRRKKPDAVSPGDEVFVPDVRRREDSGATRLFGHVTLAKSERSELASIAASRL